MNKHDSYHANTSEKAKGLAVPSSTMVAYLAVWGTSSPGYPARVCSRLLSLNGVLTADIEQGIAVAFYNAERVTADELVMVVSMAGNGAHQLNRAEVIDQMSVAQALRLVSMRES